jgi:hypothetical protein
MAFRKTFNRSERAALLAIGELFKEGLVDSDVFDFQTMTVRDEKTSESFFVRMIVFKRDLAETCVTVATPSRDTCARRADEIVHWEPQSATYLKGGFEKTFARRKYPDHVFWSRH